ncbi:MAG: T9SS type A sorting domain-containing protein [Bacteroidetes bacterium]|nr:T9SS type A sorting domain-containing protein [Bacteroidota bacterium]
MSKGNGVGSTMYIQRFDLQGNMMWVNPLDITSGGTLNGFSGNITMQPDARGNLYVVWDNSSSNVVATKVTAQGAFAWSNLRVRMSDTSQYFPQHSSAKLVGDTLYVTWVESRKLPTYFSMIQKLDSSGNKQLIASGMMVDTSSGVYGFPKLAVSDSGSIVNVWQGLESSVLAIQRIRPDGSRTWPGNRKVLSADRQNLITDSDYEVLDNNQGCNVVFWASNYSNVFGAEACSPSIISGLQLSEDNTPAFEVYPNPSDGVWRFQNIPEGTENLVLSSTSGTRIATLPVTGKEEPVLSIGGLSPGIYFISVDGKEHSFTRKVIVGR